MSTHPAPIVVFAYNRPDHLKRTLESLSANHLAGSSELIIYCDGPKDNPARHDLKLIGEVHTIAAAQAWPASLKVITAEKNLGLAQSVIQGVTQVLDIHPHVIVLEDDHVTSPWFLTFMNDALQKYSETSEVLCISGYIYPVKEVLPPTFFIKGADCWGWATWRRAWKLFDNNPQGLLDRIVAENKVDDFDFFGTYPYTQMLEDRANGKNNSWAVCWYASAYLNDSLVLYPGRSLVQNIGNDSSGVHSDTSSAWDVQLSQSRIELSDIPVQENREAKRVMADYFSHSLGTHNLASRIRNHLKRLLGKR